MTKEEAQSAKDPEADHFLEKYIDFFQRAVGRAYRGYEGFRSHVVRIRKPT